MGEGLRLETHALTLPSLRSSLPIPFRERESLPIRQGKHEPRALARTVGWVAQWNEMISDPGQKIGRPRQLYTGPTQRDYVPVDER